MFTRAQVVVSYPIDVVFDAIVESCKQTKTKVSNADRSSYQIEAKSPTTLTRFGQRVQIVLKEEQENTTIRIYENGFYGEDPRFIIAFLKDLGKRIAFKSNLKIDSVKESEEVNNIAVKSRNPMNKAAWHTPSSIMSSYCTLCKKHLSSFELHLENLCSFCFEETYGKIELKGEAAEYYGGHKAYLAGGIFSKYQSGKMYLTDHLLIFAKGDKNDASNRWEIIIPLTSVVIDRWRIEEESRRKQIAGGGSSLDNVAFGGGVIHESGKSHHLVVPYVDENGIPQEPRFGISSFGGKAIREWAVELYRAVVEAKKKNIQQDISEPEQTIPTNTSSGFTEIPQNESIDKTEDPVRILKIRLAKGEISKGEYEEMRKMIES